jgi:putative hydrolase of the HAD superfamily
VGGAARDRMTAVRWLLLDIGGVLELVDDAAWPEEFARRWERRLDLAPGDYERRLAAVDLPDATRTSGVADRYWRAVAAALGADDEDRGAMVADFWDAYCGRRNDLLLDHLATLRGRVGLAILSNSGDGAREEEERRYAFSKLFDPILYSHEIGVLKPDDAAFRLTLAALGAEPGEVLFLDDAPHNVEAARRLGIRAHLYVDADAAIRTIEQALASGD